MFTFYRCYHIINRLTSTIIYCSKILLISENPRLKSKGSNPTPRAYLGDLYNNIKSKKSKDSLRNKGLSEGQEYNQDQSQTEPGPLIRRSDSITKSCTKAYFNKILKRGY